MRTGRLLRGCCVGKRSLLTRNVSSQHKIYSLQHLQGNSTHRHEKRDLPWQAYSEKYTTSHIHMNDIRVSETPLYNYITGSQTLWHCSQSQTVATSSSDNQESVWSGRYTRRTQLAETHESAHHTTHHYRPATTTATSSRLEWLA